MRPFLVLALAAMPAGAALAQSDLAERAGQLIGVWSTGALPTPSPAGGTAHVVRTVTFEPGVERNRVEAFADAGLTQRLFVYESVGPYAVVGDWPAVPGALAAELTNTRSEVTIDVDAPDLWAGLNLGDCPLKLGEPVDISGCVSGPPFQVTDCTDLDLFLLSADGQRLQFGAEGVDRCKMRPTAADDVVFLRQ